MPTLSVRSRRGTIGFTQPCCQAVSVMYFSIEPMLTAGGPETKVLADHWTVATVDGEAARPASGEPVLVACVVTDIGTLNDPTTPDPGASATWTT